MAWQIPRTDWAIGAAPNDDDFNRIEGNTKYLKDLQSVLAVANSVILRDENGRAQISDPTAGADIANKQWVESVLGSNLKMGTYANTATTIPTHDHKTINIPYPEGILCEVGGLLFMSEDTRTFNTGAISLSLINSILDLTAIHTMLIGDSLETHIVKTQTQAAGKTTESYSGAGVGQFGENIYLNYATIRANRIDISFWNAASATRTLNFNIVYLIF